MHSDYISSYFVDVFFIALFVVFVLIVLFLFGHEWLSLKRKRRKLKIKSIKTEDLPVERHGANPIVSPSPHNDWEAGGTFNPAAWHDDTGKIHLVYRAVGSDGLSRLGYAESEDGENFYQLNYPIYEMESPRLGGRRAVKERRYDPVMYPSGGSYGGAEDPRMVAIEDRIYITCSAFDGWDFIRIALFSIKKEDFIKKRWNWSRVMLISPKGKVNKNWVLFPEKINGKFAILHSLNPEIQIDYVEHLEELESGLKKIESHFGHIEDRNEWDTRVRGVGAPPVMTKYGWLVLYHATTKEEPHKYKVGAMILDSKNPERIIARSPGPILEPDMWYENEWKAGVVYVCGAVIQDGTLYIYYGGGDRYVCVAKVPEDNLLKWIMENHGA